MPNGDAPPPGPAEEPATVDSPAPADEPAPADVSTATASDANSPEAVTTLTEIPANDLAFQLLNSLYNSFLETGWSFATFQLLILTADQEALVTGSFDAQAIVQAMYNFFGLELPADAT